ncbi:MAG: oligopeptide/dipeptide ABC transporter ATP-binding protein [Acidimicrobiia bacterium]
MTEALLEVDNIDITYGGRSLFRRRPALPTVQGASLSVRRSETVALVGESGSGKTTIARVVAGLHRPSRGHVRFEGVDITNLVGDRSRSLHRQIQYVFQNPDASLNPRRRVSQILGRPLEHFFEMRGADRARRVEELLAAVHLPPGYASRFPTQLSGGERQRVAIARALAAKPKLIVCDEVVSALDVSVQANILTLLAEVQASEGIAYLFITHDLAVVRWIAHHVYVLYLGRILEGGTPAEIFAPPYQPYTAMLLESVPEPDPSGPLLRAEDPTTASSVPPQPEGCPFTPRCPHRLDQICEREPPPHQRLGDTHEIWCQIPAGELARRQSVVVS